MNTDTEDLLARFSEALQPLGMPDLSNLARKDRPRRLTASDRHEHAWAAVRFAAAALTTIIVHLAALKYIFWLG